MPWIKRTNTANRYNNCVRTIERWEKAGERIRQSAKTEEEALLGFPRSRIINGRKYDDAAELDRWDAECAAAARTTRTPPNAGRSPAKREQAGANASPKSDGDPAADFAAGPRVG